MAKNNGMPQKKSMTSFIIYIIIAVVLLIVGMWGGYVLQETAHKNGKANFQRALDKAEDYVNIESFFNAAKSALSEKGTAKTGAIRYPKRRNDSTVRARNTDRHVGVRIRKNNLLET